jgi:hypothetical protein
MPIGSIHASSALALIDGWLPALALYKLGGWHRRASSRVGGCRRGDLNPHAPQGALGPLVSGGGSSRNDWSYTCWSRPCGSAPRAFAQMEVGTRWAHGIRRMCPRHTLPTVQPCIVCGWQQGVRSEGLLARVGPSTRRPPSPAFQVPSLRKPVNAPGGWSGAVARSASAPRFIDLRTPQKRDHPPLGSLRSSRRAPASRTLPIVRPRRTARGVLEASCASSPSPLLIEAGRSGNAQAAGFSRTVTPISHAARQTRSPSRRRPRRIIAG